MSSRLLAPPGSSLPRLPVIEHPLSRLGDPETLSLRGFSRAGGARDDNEEIPCDRKTPQTASSRNTDKSLTLTPVKHQIPQGVQVTAAADQSKARLPIFGQRADIGSRAESRASAVSSRSSAISRPGTQLRIEVDELEHILREKLRSGGYFSLRQLFKNNDPEGKGQVNSGGSRLGDGAVMCSVFTTALQTSKVTALDLQAFYSSYTYPEFCTEQGKAKGGDVLLMMLTKFLGRFISSKQYQQLLLRLQLQEKTIIKFEELYAALRDPLPSGRPTWLDPVSRRGEEKTFLTASQVHAQLKEKTKQRYDADGMGAIQGDALLKRLGNEMRNQSSNNADIKGQPREISKAEWERKTSISIEKWLKDKFREGFRTMKEEFEKHDPHRTGKVQKNHFLAVLERFDLKLKDEHLNLFLARCDLKNTPSGISYIDLLRNFQDRSDKGITHKILSNPNHRFHREGGISPLSTLTAVEAKLTDLFQSDFLALLTTFEKIDKYNRNVVSQQEFRAAIESRFGVEITDEDFEQLLDRMPLDEDGNVKYPHFMAMFDSRRGVPSLFDEKSVTSSTFDISEEKMHDQGRTPAQLFKIIKKLIHNNYPAVEKAFEELDDMNSRRLTQENMYLLLKQFDIHPTITRGEIRRVWDTFITNQDKTLDYLEFVRHFGYSPKSACFPNAKISPPKKGDGDFKIRSKKLNCDSDILVDSVRAKVEYLWDDLHREFEDLDPYRTGFVSKEEFKDILNELCVHLNNYECEMLTKKFETRGDGRVSYIEFLTPFVTRRQTWKNKSNMVAVMQNQSPELALRDIIPPPVPALHSVTSQMSSKLQGEWKTLRRAFKKLDTDSSGYLSLPEFRSVLKLCNFVLDEDEVYHVMSRYDQNMDGRINYKSFLEHTCNSAQPSASSSSLAKNA
ncbi:EF-hand calcium-binding domain-containing protein 6-like [Bombina bombina]|uniref:EF-hand calcium-binding domain-containing protein 6-like n=1 Tax=Bombina bombina TaxID=8345 RepID=UPI00235AE5A3|nr:EF-hand calcium-binding domain-containing protein 6-like [Bombina bombina]